MIYKYALSVKRLVLEIRDVTRHDDVMGMSVIYLGVDKHTTKTKTT
jgi:hypothetical protein